MTIINVRPQTSRDAARKDERKDDGSDGGARPRTTYRDDLLTVALGLWFVIGLLLDAWAHNNLIGLESFFTPWHLVFYTGFTASAAWVVELAWRHRRPGRSWAATIPVGYGLSALALPVFMLSGLGDFTWHTVFGVEQGLQILFSPTHLGLATSMLLILTSPLRSAWQNPALPAAPRLPALLPAAVGTGFATALVLLFLQYANALVWPAENVIAAFSNPYQGRADLAGNPSPVGLASSIMMTTVVLLVPLLLLARRWQLPPGFASVVFVTVAALAGAETAGRSPAILISIVAAGVAVDLLLWRLRPGPDRRTAVLALAALTPLVTWSLFLAAASLARGGVPAVTEFWTGVPVLAALFGLLLAVLAVPPPVRPQ